MECLCEFRPHLNEKALALIYAVASLFHGGVDSLLEVHLVEGVKHIAEPFAVQVLPVSLVREVLETLDVPPIHLEDVLHRETFYLRHRRDQNLVSS